MRSASAFSDFRKLPSWITHPPAACTAAVCLFTAPSSGFRAVVAASDRDADAFDGETLGTVADAATPEEVDEASAVELSEAAGTDAVAFESAESETAAVPFDAVP